MSGAQTGAKTKAVALTRLAVLGLMAGLFLALMAPGAQGHTDLLQGSPGPGQRAGGTVDFVDLAFGAPVSEVEIMVTGPDGGEVDGEMMVSDGQIIRYRMDPLTTIGRYVVSWEMVSDDGDFTISNFFFTYDADGFQPVRLGSVETVTESGAVVQQTARVIAVVSLIALCVVLFLLLRRRRADLAAVVAGRDSSGS